MGVSSVPSKEAWTPLVRLFSAWAYVPALAMVLTLPGCGETQPLAAMADPSPAIDPFCQPLMPIIGSQPWDDGGYLALLAQKLLNSDAGECKLYMLQEGDGRETAVQVVQVADGSYGVVSRRMVEPVFATADDYRELEVAVEKRHVPIPAESFRQLDELWREFLFRIRVPTSLNSFDRPHYYFSGTAGPLIITGYADGPKPGTCIAQLRDIGDLLFALPAFDDAQRATQLVSLGAQIAALHDRLARTPER
jgi:hypothetical protein